MDIKRLNNNSSGSFSSNDDKKVIRNGRDFIRFINTQKEKNNGDDKESKIERKKCETIKVCLSDKKLDLKNLDDIKKLFLFAQEIIEETNKKRNKSINAPVTIEEMAGVGDKKNLNFYEKAAQTAALSLFKSCDFSYDANGKVIKGKGNGIIEEKDLIALVSFLDEYDGKADGKTEVRFINKMAKKSLLWGGSYHEEMFKIVRQLD